VFLLLETGQGLKYSEKPICAGITPPCAKDSLIELLTISLEHSSYVIVMRPGSNTPLGVDAHLTSEYHDMWRTDSKYTDEFPQLGNEISRHWIFDSMGIDS
jgi:hypothetical protein